MKGFGTDNTMGAIDAASALAGKNPVAAALAIAGVAFSAAAGTEVDIQGPAGIKMLTNATISGMAKSNIEYKCVTKYSAVAAGIAEMLASGVSIFGLIKADMKVSQVELSSMVFLEQKSPRISARPRRGCTSRDRCSRSRARRSPGSFHGKVDWKTPLMTFTDKTTVEKTFFVGETSWFSKDAEIKVKRAVEERRRGYDATSRPR